jgi:predicted site-specific integrase-resolvase
MPSVPRTRKKKARASLSGRVRQTAAVRQEERVPQPKANAAPRRAAISLTVSSDIQLFMAVLPCEVDLLLSCALSLLTDGAGATHAVAYLRVSTDEQANKDLSIPMQERAIRAYAAQRGITICTVFVVAGASGRSDEGRPALKEMLGAVLEPSSRISQVIVFQTSRFMRNVESSRVLKSRLRRAGVRVVSATQETTDDPSGRLMEGVLEVFDEYESEVNGLRTSSCMRQAACNGY